jgi:hypothetical protein
MGKALIKMSKGGAMDARDKWFNELKGYTVERLQDELENEIDAYEDMQSYDYYDDKERQLGVTRGNISYIRNLLAEKSMQ